MTIVLDALIKSLSQYDDWKLVRIALLGALYTFAILILGWVLVITIFGGISFADIPFIGWLIAFVGSYLSTLASIFLFGGMAFIGYILFPPLSILIIGLFLDQVIQAVEDRFYPNAPKIIKQDFYKSLKAAFRLMFVMILVNFLLLFVYLFTLFIPFLTWMIFIAVNSWFVGREYMEATMLRRYEIKQIATFRYENKIIIWIMGVVILLIMSIPVLNLFAPIIGAAMATHIMHRLIDINFKIPLFNKNRVAT